MKTQPFDGLKILKVAGDQDRSQVVNEDVGVDQIIQDRRLRKLCSHLRRMRRWYVVPAGSRFPKSPAVRRTISRPRKERRETIGHPSALIASSLSSRFSTSSSQGFKDMSDLFIDVPFSGKSKAEFSVRDNRRVLFRPSGHRIVTGRDTRRLGKEEMKIKNHIFNSKDHTKISLNDFHNHISLSRRFILGEPEKFSLDGTHRFAGKEAQQTPQNDADWFLIRNDDAVVPAGEKIMKLDEIPDVVSEESSILMDGGPQLLLIGQSKSVGMNSACDIVSTATKDFRQEGADVFVKIKSYLRHAASVCWRISLSRRDL